MLKINFNLTDINIQLPTCFTSILLGESVTRSTVNLGEYTVGQITSDSATPVNFQISLQNCVRISSIKTKLKSNVVGVNNPLLLGNTLTGTDDAKGAGVLIEGLPNSKIHKISRLSQMMRHQAITMLKMILEKTMEFITQIILMPTVVLQPRT